MRFYHHKKSVILLILCVLICFDISAALIEPKQKKVLICGVCKNVASTVNNTILNIEALGKGFRDYHVIIYENNSTDGTAKAIAKWAKKNKCVTFISENLTKEQLVGAVRSFNMSGEPSRMDLIARARNIVLSVARDAKYNDFEYLVMADFDFSKPWPIHEILKTVETEREWDCVLANGLSKSHYYYDRYAFRNEWYPFGPELLGKDFWDEVISKRLNLPDTSNWLPVYSAFGGLGIYKRASIIKFSYTGHVTDDLKADYKNVLQSLPRAHLHVQKYLKVTGISPQSEFSKVPILFQLNSGFSNYPVCCEHVTLHASMRLHGFGKIYINPRMIMQYDIDFPN